MYCAPRPASSRGFRRGRATLPAGGALYTQEMRRASPCSRPRGGWRLVVVAASLVLLLVGSLAHRHEAPSSATDRCAACVIGHAAPPAPPLPRLQPPPPARFHE